MIKSSSLWITRLHQLYLNESTIASFTSVTVRYSILSIDLITLHADRSSILTSFELLIVSHLRIQDMVAS